MPDQTKSNTRHKTQYTLPKELELDTPFWAFSLSIWKNTEAQTSLLFLQDEYKLRVNRLLFCSWLGFEQKELLIDELITDPLLTQWSEDTVTPLRNIRKQLKSTAALHPQLRATVQSAELQAEQIEQALLFQRANKLSRPTTKQNTLGTLSFNLLSYTVQELKEEECLPHQVIQHLVTLIQTAIPNHERSHIEAYFPGR